METKMQERVLNQSGWSMQKFKQRTMYIHELYPSGRSYVELPYKCRKLLNTQNEDAYCFIGARLHILLNCKC